MQYSFDKQKFGWLDQRYIPVLHNRGIIHKDIIGFLGSSEECFQLLKELECIEKNYEMLIAQIDVLCELLYEKKLYKEKIVELGELSKRVKNQCTELLKIKNGFRYEYKLEQWNENILTYERLGDIEDWLHENSHGDNYCHFDDVKKLIDKISNANMFQLFERLKQRWDIIYQFSSKQKVLRHKMNGRIC